MRFFPKFLSTGAGAAILATTLVAGAEPPAPSASTDDVEEPEYPPPSTRWKVAGVGFASAAAFYGAGLGLSYAYPDTPGMTDMRIPIAGPWIGISHNGCPASEPDCSTALVAVRTILMALDGVAQAGSLAIIVEGLFMPTQQPVLAPSEKPRPPTGAPPATPAPGGDKNLFFLPTPMTVGAGGIGVGVVGRF